MAAHGPSMQPGNTEATTDGVVPSSPIRTPDAVRTAVWAVGLTLLSNIANVLKQLTDVIDSLGQLRQFAQEHLWIVVVIVGLLVIWGNVLLFRFLYHRLKRRIPTAYQVLAGAACLLLVTVIFVSNLFSLNSLLRGQIEVRDSLLSGLASAYDIKEGGFRNALTKAGFADPWTTAQAIKASLSTGSFDSDRLKKAFTYIEAHRANDGFEVIYNTDSKVRFFRTEASAWVALAYLDSISKSDFWSAEERPAAVARTQATLKMIAAQQDPNSGGWSPVPGKVAKHTRTYATMMSLWALTEGLLAHQIAPADEPDTGLALEGGTRWLINHYESNLGWEENPRYQLQKSFPGLTYQVLFVLQRAQLVAGHNAFQNTEAYKQIKREFKSTISTADIKDQTSVPTEYIMVGESACPVDFLAYPWLLSVLPTITEDADVPSSDRRYLRGVLQTELGKLPDVPRQLRNAETWQVTENLIGLSNFMNYRQKPR